MLDKHGWTERLAHHAILAALRRCCGWAAAASLRSLEHARHEGRLAHALHVRPVRRWQQQVTDVKSLHDRVVLVSVRRRSETNLEV